MSHSVDRAAFVKIGRRIDPQATLLRAWPLHGGVSAQVTAFEIGLPDGSTRTLVLRVHGAVDRAQNPHVTEHEFRVLQLVQDAGLPAPAPVHYDPSGDILPLPYIVIEYVAGAPAQEVADPARLAPQMAKYLARLHAILAHETNLRFLRRVEDGVAGALQHPPDTMDEALQEARIREALAAVWPMPQRNAPALLHGDFWPGNVLWRNDKIAAVIDWEDAAFGDPLADLANARLEMFWAFGEDAMQRFTDRYLPRTKLDVTYLPYWDLCAALRPLAGMANWGLHEDALQTLRERHCTFTAQALNRVDGP